MATWLDNHDPGQLATAISNVSDRRPDHWDAVRERHSLAEVARRTGYDLSDGTTGDVRISCAMPDHIDVTPSMILHLDTDRFHCFGCHASGDVIQWVRSIYGAGAGEAVGLLDTPGPLPEPPSGVAVDHHTATVIRTAAERPELDRTSPKRVKAALAAAWGYYTFGSLHDEAMHYLRGIRGIDVSALEAEQGRPLVGHTPHRAKDQLVTRLREKGFSDDELVDAGLAHRYPDGRVIDTYRDRTVLPVRDDSDAVVGLIGRYDGPRTPGKDGPPKYLNPTRTATYDKSVNLYQPLPAPTHPDGRVIVVEGTLDAMSIAIAAIRTGQADRYCPVTQSGKELSDTQLVTVFGIHPNPPMISFDGDAAGRDSNIRLARRAAAEQGFTVAVISLPDGHDPASWLAERGDRGLGVFATDGDGAEASPPKIPRRERPIAPPVPLHRTKHGPRVDRLAPSSAHGESFAVDEPAISLA